MAITVPTGQIKRDIIVNRSTGQTEEIYFQPFLTYEKSLGEAKPGVGPVPSRIIDNSARVILKYETPDGLLTGATLGPNGWTLAKDKNGNPVLGEGAQRALLETGPNSLTNQIKTSSANALVRENLSRVEADRVLQTSLKAKPTFPGATDPLEGAGVATAQEAAAEEAARNRLAQANREADPNAGVGTAPSPTFTQQESFDAIKGLNVRTSYATLSYPIKRSLKQDYIKFEMLEYAPRKFSGNTLSGFEAAATGGSIDALLGQQVFGTRDQFFKDAYKKDRKAIGTVSLPISSPISDTNSVSWNDDSMGAFAVLGAGIFKDLVSGPGTQTPQTPPPDPQGTGNAQTKTLVVNQLTKAALGGATGANLLTRTTGAVINPNLELLFNGPQLRTFSFTFPLVARSKPESEQILQIIRFFKQGMSVKRSTSALFLKSPHTFAIKYIYAREENKAIVESAHPWINQIKECALTNCNVNYTPAGNYATYANGAMSMYEITLNFSELEPIFDDDYASLDGNSAGKDTTVGY